MERYAATCQVALRCDKITAVGPQREMEHSGRLTRHRRIHVIPSRGKKRKGGLVPCHENWNAFPHSLVAAFKPKNLDVPVCRTFNIPDGECDVIESFQFKHGAQLNCGSILEKARFGGACRSGAGMILVLREIDLAKTRARRCVSTHA